MDQIKIGRFLKELRNEKILTQEQMAEQLNVSGRTVSRWETGRNMPDIGMLVELAEFFNVNISEIIDGERKSEKMNQEEKEMLLKVADYTENEQFMFMKRVFIISITGLVALLFALLLNLFELGKINLLFLCIEVICFGLAVGAMMTCIFFAGGILSKIRNNHKLRRIAYILRIICPIIIVICIVISIILTIFNN